MALCSTLAKKIILSLFLGCCSLFYSQVSKSQIIEKFEVVDFVFQGLNRTSESWLRDYLDVSFPFSANEQDLAKLRSKILTTGVFHKANVSFFKFKSQRFIKIEAAEKWTTIPVVRAEVGGGTPLWVAGIYDQHSFGRLWTLGSEFRKYGDEAPGFVFGPNHLDMIGEGKILE